MPTLRELMERLLTDGKIDSRETEALTRLLYAEGRIDRAEAEFLFQTHRQVERASPAFNQFFHAALKRHILVDGAIEPDTIVWLRRMILTDGKVTESERKLLREVRSEAAEVCPEFEALFGEYMK